jgi:hypothetical protein
LSEARASRASIAILLGFIAERPKICPCAQFFVPLFPKKVAKMWKYQILRAALRMTKRETELKNRQHSADDFFYVFLIFNWASRIRILCWNT